MGQDEELTAAIPTQATAAPPAGRRGARSVSEVFGDSGTAEEEAVRRRVAKAAAQKVVAHRRRGAAAKGRVARAETPRRAAGRVGAGADRADPVALLAGQETSRVQELVPVRHARMAMSASPSTAVRRW